MRIHLIPILINIHIGYHLDLYEEIYLNKHKGKAPKICWDIIDSYNEELIYDTHTWWYGIYFNLDPDIFNILCKNYNLKFTKNSVVSYTITKGFKGLSKILHFLRLLKYGDDMRSFKKL